MVSEFNQREVLSARRGIVPARDRKTPYLGEQDKTERLTD